MLKDDLHPWVMRNLTKIVKIACEYGIEHKRFSVGREGVIWLGSSSSAPDIKLEGDTPLAGLVDAGLLEPKYGDRTTFYSITRQGIRAVEADLEIPSLFEVGVPSIQIGDQYINVAIGAGAVAEQVLGNLGDSNAELTEAIKELARVISDEPSDRPTVLSQLSQVMKILSQVPSLVEIVAPMVIKALEAVGLLS